MLLLSGGSLCEGQNPYHVIIILSWIMTFFMLIITIERVYADPRDFFSNIGEQSRLIQLPRVFSHENDVFLVWQDNSTGNDEIFLRKSSNGGSTFDNPINLSNNNSSSLFPQISSFGNNTFVVWQDNSTGHHEIFLRKSSNGGSTFDNPIKLSNNNSSSLFPQISSFGNNTFVVWQDNSTGNDEIFLRKSSNGGSTFDNPINLSNNNSSSLFPQISSFGNNTFVVWQDNSTGHHEIFLRKSSNGGSTFDNPINLSNNNSSSLFPQISSFGNNTFVVWQDNSTGNDEVILRKSSNGGSTFSSKKNLSNNNSSSLFPQISSFGNYTFVVWQDNSTGNDEIFLRKSSNGGSTFSSKKNLSNNNSSSLFPQISSFGNNTFVVWQDNSTGNDEIFLRKSSNGYTLFYDPKKNSGLHVQSEGGPIVNDPQLEAKLIVKGISFPTHMAFLNNNDLLVLEKNNGLVKRITNGVLHNDSLIDLSVANGVERGLLGIAISKHENATFVFLYYTESSIDGDDVSQGKIPAGNRLYRYELVDNKLTNPMLMLNLPVTPGSAHNGGKTIIGPDGNVYLTIGDLNRSNANESNSTITKAQNHDDAIDADGRAGILRITQDGKPVKEGILGNGHPLNKYFAYGIRNSFGMDFDPITGKLWDVENGPEFGDEINLIEPGFNGGWNKVQGVWEPKENKPGEVRHNVTGLFDFNGSGTYRVPELTWYQPSPGASSIVFLDSDKLGSVNANDLFVSGFHDGNIYHFKLNANRTGLLLDGGLKDKVVNTKNETNGTIFAKGFGGITDMQVGPDGYLYVLSLYASGADCDEIRRPGKICIPYNKSLDGALFRIQPR